jgi:hypothetical protein
MNSNFLTKRSEPKPPPDLEAARRAILSLHKGAAPVDEAVEDMLRTDAERAARKKQLKRGPKKTQLSRKGVANIAKLHAAGGRPLGGDFLSKAVAADDEPEYDDSVDAVRKSLSAAPRALAPLANPRINAADIARIVARGSLRKRVGSAEWWNTATWQERRDAMAKGVKMPPQSNNATSTSDDLADTGATNLWNDEETASPKPTPVGGFTDPQVSPNDPRIAAAVAEVPKDPVEAIKQALLPANKRRMMP